MRRVAWAAAIATAGYCGVYTFVYLLRWQWNRAMFMSFGFLAAEIVIATLVVLRHVERGSREHTPADVLDPDVLAALQASAPERNHFAWLDPKAGTMNVFVTLLVASGVVVSAVAWLVEKIASNTSTRALEHRLAQRLSTLAPPDELIADDGELLAAEQPYHPDPALRLLLRPLAERADDRGPWSG
jgi:hypothetical protein